jgi:hypothetical protein
MMELNLTLDFACCRCGQPVSVQVQCSGDGLMMPERQGRLAAVNVPCPTCGQINQLFFDPTGAVRSVRPYACIRIVPEPSVN